MRRSVRSGSTKRRTAEMPEYAGCRCHASELYLSLVKCPACGHNSLDRLPGWEGCERRACGYQRVLEEASR